MSYVVAVEVEFWRDYPFTEIVQVLRKQGWNFFGGNIVYRPRLLEGDLEEDYNWTVGLPDSWEHFKVVVREKQALQETVGIKLEWFLDPWTIMDITLNSERRLCLHLMSEYPKIPDTNVPDFTWILKNAVVVLNQAGYEIAEIECFQDRR